MTFNFMLAATGGAVARSVLDCSERLHAVDPCPAAQPPRRSFVPPNSRASRRSWVLAPSIVAPWLLLSAAAAAQDSEPPAPPPESRATKPESPVAPAEAAAPTVPP